MAPSKGSCDPCDARVLSTSSKTNLILRFLSKFTSCGINQTLHQIYASVETNVSAVLPLKKINCVRSEDILVAESLIIGDIPATYLMAEDKSDLLNMVG